MRTYKLSVYCEGTEILEEWIDDPRAATERALAIANTWPQIYDSDGSGEHYLIWNDTYTVKVTQVK